MKTTTKDTDQPKRDYMIRTIFIVVCGALLMTGIYWRSNQGTHLDTESSVSAANTPAPQILPETQEHKPLANASAEPYMSSSAIHASLPDQVISSSHTARPEHMQLFESLWDKLHDRSLQKSLTAQQIIATPDFASLPIELMQRLVDEAMTMIVRGELDEKVFMTNKVEPGRAPNNDNSIPATLEQYQSLQEIKTLLHEQVFSQSLTASQMLAMQEVQDLPSQLRQELTTEVMQMLRSGELDSSQFLAPPVKADTPSPNESTQAPTTITTRAEPPTATHEQLQNYQDILARMYNTDFMASSSFELLLTSPEMQTLPEHLRAKLIVEATGLIKQGEDNLQ